MRREILVPHFFGSETEYGYTVKKGEIGTIGNNFTPPESAHIGMFLENGGKIHTDCGLIEYATPECGTLEELVLHELAGEELVWDAYGKGQTKAKTIHKRCSTPTRGHSSGAHESYSTAIDIWSNKETQGYNINALAVHFATRTPYIGAGKHTDDGFVLGQKMYDIKVESGSDNTSNKALVNLRNQPHAGGSDIQTPSTPQPDISRLHVVCGDANISPWAIRMKFGTTSLVLRLLEHGKNISDLFLEDPLQAAKIVAGSVDGMNEPLLLKSKKIATALDIQEALAERAKKLSDEIKLPDEELAIIEDWMSIINALRGNCIREDGKPGLEQLDWYTKNQLLEHDKERIAHKENPPKDTERENGVELLFDQVPKGKGVKLREHPRRFSLYAPSEDEIKHAKKTPPKGRAKLRGRVIKELVRRGGQAVVGVSIDWDRLKRSVGRTHIFGPVEANYDDEIIEKRVKEILN